MEQIFGIIDLNEEKFKRENTEVIKLYYEISNSRVDD